MDNELRDILMGISGDIKGMRMELAGIASKVDQSEKKVDHFDLRFDNVELERTGTGRKSEKRPDPYESKDF
ncbi:hypothetical protein [Shouchella clausii]|uniref:hypothetical protein n=1 Tax=Shouchella clausii TaxID=79880 RepID=UPI000BA6FF75|nr:hypothetical protein [Shouchella clausii]PAE96829.1 hypothetical protein CHH70_00440 [Shouchella clausii]